MQNSESSFSSLLNFPSENHFEYRSLELMRIVFETWPSKLKVSVVRLKWECNRDVTVYSKPPIVNLVYIEFFSLYRQSIISLLLISSVKKAKPEHCCTDGATLHLTLWRTFQDPQHILNTMACCTVGVLIRSFYIYPLLLSQEQIFPTSYNSSNTSKASLRYYISPLSMSPFIIPSWAASLIALIFIACIYTHNCHVPDWNASQWAYQLILHQVSVWLF